MTDYDPYYLRFEIQKRVEGNWKMADETTYLKLAKTIADTIRRLDGVPTRILDRSKNDETVYYSDC